MLMRVGLSSKLSSLMFISGLVVTLALDGAEKLLMHLWATISVVRVVVTIPEICPQSLGHGIRKILVKKALSEPFLLEILDLNGNWPVNLAVYSKIRQWARQKLNVE
jgi:hypothetical protein